MNRFEYVKSILADRPSTPGETGQAYAPANIALVKYWGKRQRELNLPATDSFSISLGDFGATTTLTPASQDHFILHETEIAPDTPEFQKVFGFLDLLRPEACPLAVESRSTIPIAAGLASSASGFAALTLAANDLFGFNLSHDDASRIARLGSGSACRSIRPGFSLWHAGTREDGMDSFADFLPDEWPDLRIGFLVLSGGKKEISSRDAMNQTTETSILYQAWPQQIEQDLPRMKEAVANQDFEQLGKTAENNAMAMHATMMASVPSVLYWQTQTLETIRKIRQLREDGLPVYLTMDAGPNVKLLFKKETEETLKKTFPELQTAMPFGHLKP